MRFNLRRFLKISFLVILSFILIAFVVLAVASGVTSIPGEERVPSGEKRNQALYVEMRDGVKVVLDIWFPADLQEGQKIPVLMQMTRYQRTMAVGSLQRALHGLGFIDLQKELPGFYIGLSNDHGYAFIMVDARGSGASFGSRDIEFSPDEVADYGELLEWITQQPWSNGKVGTIGVSYDGNTAEIACVPNHPGLQAAAPLYNDFDPQYGLLQPGGVTNTYINLWSDMVAKMDKNDICALAEAKGLRCALIKLWAPGVKPVDEDKNRDLLKAAVVDHAGNANVGEQVQSTIFRDDRVGTTDFLSRSISPYRLAEKNTIIRCTDVRLVGLAGCGHCRWNVEPFSDI